MGGSARSAMIGGRFGRLFLFFYLIHFALAKIPHSGQVDLALSGAQKADIPDQLGGDAACLLIGSTSPTFPESTSPTCPSTAVVSAS